MTDPLGFRQKGPGVPRGVDSEATDAVPSEQSGGFAANIAPPIWRQFVNNKGFQDSFKGAIDAEKDMQRRESRQSRSSGGGSWSGKDGKVSRLNRGIPEEYDAETLIDHPELGGVARKSIWDRDVNAAKRESEDADLRLKDPSFHARGLAAKDREAIEAEGKELQETDPQHIKLKARLVADSEYQAEKADLAQRSWDAQARARQIESMDPDSWLAQRNQPTAQEKRASTVAAAQAQRSEADVAHESGAKEMADIDAKLAAGVTGPEVEVLKARRVEVSNAMGLAAQTRVEADAPIKQVQAEAKAEIENPENRGFIGNTLTALQRGYAGAAQGANILQGATDATNAQDIARYEEMKKANPASKEFQDFMAAEGFEKSAWEFIKSPVRIITEVIAESAAQMVPGIALGVAGGAIGGAVTSAPTGGVASPATVPIGAAVGAAIGAGSGSGLAEYGSALMQSMQEAGMDATDPASIQSFFSDPEKLSAAREFAIKRAVPIALFDAVSAGLAGKFVKPIKVAVKAGEKVGAGRIVAATGKEVAAQALAGASGEAAGQLVSEGEISEGKSIFLEGIAEIGSGPVEVASNLREFGKPDSNERLKEKSRIDTALQAIDPEAPAPTSDEVTKAALFTTSGMGPEGLADGVLIERELAEVEAADTETLAQAQAALDTAKTTGGDVKAAEALVAQAKVATGRAELTRAVLKVAAGLPFANLTPKQAESLGYKIEGDEINEMTPEEREKAGVPERMLYKGPNGFPILTDAALAIAAAASPRASARVTMSEEQALIKAATPPAAPAPGAQQYEVTLKSGKKIKVAAATEQEARTAAAGHPDTDFMDPVVGAVAIPSNEPNTQGLPSNQGQPANPVGSQAQVPLQQVPVVTPPPANPLATSGGTPLAVPAQAQAKGAVALTHAKTRIAEMKAKSQKLAAAIVDTGARGEMVEGKIHVNPELVIQEALDAGLTEEQAIARFDAVLDEEITHLAQTHSADAIWKQQGSPGEFNVWFEEHYGNTIWQGEFVAKGKAEIVRGLYTGTTAADRKAWDAMDAAGKAASAAMPQYAGLAAWDGMKDSHKALEGIRVMKQRWSGKSATEASRLWTDISETLYNELKELLRTLRVLVRKGNLSPAIQQEIEQLAAALKNFDSRNPKSDPKKPAKNGKGDGTGKPPGKGSDPSPAINGEAESSGLEGSIPALVEGQQVVVTKNGVRYEGVIGNYDGQVITKNNGFRLMLPDGTSKGFILDRVTIEVISTPPKLVGTDSESTSAEKLPEVPQTPAPPPVESAPEVAAEPTGTPRAIRLHQAMSEGFGWTGATGIEWASQLDEMLSIQESGKRFPTMRFLSSWNNGMNLPLVKAFFKEVGIPSVKGWSQSGIKAALENWASPTIEYAPEQSPATPAAPQTPTPQSNGQEKGQGNEAEVLNSEPTGAQSPAASNLTPAEQAAKDFFNDLGEGLDSAPLQPEDFYKSKGIPRDKRVKFMEIADGFYDEGVRTPQDLAAKLEKIGNGKLRAYSAAVWSSLQSSYPELPNFAEWSGVYAEMDASTDQDAEIESEAPPIETVTAPAAETKAAKAVAKKPDTNVKKLKAQKEYLLAALDKAIEEARETILLTEAGNDKLQVEASYKGADNGPWSFERAIAENQDMLVKYDIADLPSPDSEVGKIVTKKNFISSAKAFLHTDGIMYPLNTEGSYELLLAAIERENQRQLPKIEIEVPGDGTFRIVNAKPNLRDFRKKAATKFPTSTPTVATPRPGPISPTAITPIGKPKELGDFQKIAAIAITKDETRYVLKAIHNDGENIVATDGRRALVITRKTIGSAEKPANLDAKTLKPMKNEDGKPLNYPNWRQVIPQHFDEEIPIDTAVMQKIAIQAAEMTSDKQNSVYLWRDASGKLGLTSQSADVGMFAGGDIDPDTAKLLVAVNSDFFNDGLIAMRRLGFDKVKMQYTDEMSPIVLVADGVKYVLMPMRGDAQPFHPLSKAAEDAEIARQAELDAAAEEREARAEATRVKEAERIAKIVGEVEPEVETPADGFKAGDNVTFTPNAKQGTVVKGVLQEQIKNTSGGVGYQIFNPTTQDPYRVTRVWAEDGVMTASKAESPAAPAEPTETPRSPRLIMGKGTIGAFDGFSHGDVFQDATDNRWILAGGNGWSLYPEGETNKPDYTKPPHPLVVNIKEGNELRDVFRRMKEEAETQADPAETPAEQTERKRDEEAERQSKQLAIMFGPHFENMLTSARNLWKTEKEWRYNALLRLRENITTLLIGFTDSTPQAEKIATDMIEGKPTIIDKVLAYKPIKESELKAIGSRPSAITGLGYERGDRAVYSHPKGAPVMSNPSPGVVEYRGFKITKSDGIQLGYQTSKGRGKGRKSSGYDIADKEGTTIKFVNTLKEAKEYVDSYMGDSSPTAKPKKPKGPSRMDMVENYFTPGKVVDSYGGKDRVISFERGDGEMWSVTVEAVDGREPTGPRSHFTMPSEKDLVKAWKEKDTEKKSPSQIAADNWPEDEAGQVLSMWKDAETRADYTDAEILAALDKDREHFNKVFSTEDDAADLNARFNAALDKWIADEGIGKQAPEKPSNRIEDFGEKILGAKKDLWGKFTHALEQDLPYDVADMAISKSFPEPDYESAIAQGIPVDSLATYKAIRDAIPSKPRKGYKLERWATMFRGIHPLMQKLATGGELSGAEIDATSKLLRGGNLGDKVNFYRDLGFPAFQKADDWRIIDGVSVFFENGVKLEKPITKTVGSFKGRFTDIDSTNEDRRGHIEVLDRIRERIIKQIEQPAEKKAKSTTFSIYSDRLTKDVFIGKKAVNGVIRLKTGFSNAKFARTYLEDNQAALEEQWNGMGAKPDYRRQVNAPRQGPMRRDGDATPEQFQEAFGFRGVQFGNWVEDNRRQVDINEAFDAFMDLAEALGIPPRAVSLDGSLGLAFGARGHAGAAAHYEPGQVVINLTKKAGPGSLAHEWFHAFDNYFSRLDKTGETKAKPLDAFATTGAGAPKNMRPVVWDAFKNIRTVLATGPFAERSKKLDDAKSKPYYQTTIEKAARAFERYTVDRLEGEEISNDYLVNIVKDFDPALPTAEEMNAGIREAFDKLFGIIDSVSTDTGVKLYSAPLRADSPEWKAMSKEQRKAHVDGLKSAPLPKANSFPRGVPQGFTEEATDHQQASGKNLTHERAGFGSAANREQLDVVTAYYDTINDIQTNADNLKEARRMLADNPADIDAKLKDAGTNKVFNLTPADHVAMQLRINQLTEQAGDNKQLQAENGARMLAYRIMRGDVARVLQIGWDRDLKPAERALAALTEAIYMPSKKIQKAIASKPLSERKAAITKATESRIAAVTAELAKINLKLSDITKENDKLKLANSKLVKEALAARPKIQQNVLKMIQQGASLEDIKRRLNVAPEEAKKILAEVRADLLPKIKLMLAAGKTAADIAKELGKLSSAPLGANNAMTDAQMDAEAKRILEVLMGIPEEIRVKNIKPKKVAKVKPVNVMEADWSRPKFTDNMNDWTFDTKDRANIMQRVEIIRGLAGAIGKISSLKPDKQVQAMAALSEINDILAKYGTDTKDIFESSQSVESYGFDINDINHVGAVARLISTMDADVVDKGIELIYANMLSGLQTMLVNATAIIPATWEVTVGRAYDLAVNAIVRDPMSAQLGESKYILKAIKPAWLRAMSNFKAAFISQHPMFDRDVLAHEIDWDKILGGGGYRINGSISGKKGDIIRIPMRLLAATDDFNRTLMACVEVGTIAFRIAKARGMKPGTPEFDKFIKTEVNTPGSPSYLIAAGKASRAIFSNPLPGQQDPTTGKKIEVKDLGDVVGYAAASLNKFASQEHDNMFAKAALAAVRVSFFPFQRTPFNILRKGVRHTLNPFSVFDILLGTYQNSRKDNLDGTKSWKWNANGRNPELVERVGQQLQGATLMLILAAMTAGEGDEDDQDKNFIITGSSPFTPRGRAERETQMRSGVGPYRISFRQDGKERFGVSYGRFEPIATTLAATIDLMKSVKRSNRAGGDNSQAAAAALGGFAAQAQDKSFMKGISDLIGLGTNILAEPDVKDNRKFQQFLASRFAMVFPNLIKQPIREMDENFRERSDSFMQELLYQVVPAGQKPAKLDPYGDKVTKPGNAAGRIVDMMEIGTDKVNPVDSMLLRFRDKHPDKAWFPTAITSAEFKNPRTGKTEKMTGPQLATFRELSGKRTKAILKAQNLNYANPTDNDVKKVKSAYEQAKSETKKGLAFRFSKQPTH